MSQKKKVAGKTDNLEKEELCSSSGNLLENIEGHQSHQHPNPSGGFAQAEFEFFADDGATQATDQFGAVLLCHHVPAHNGAAEATRNPVHATKGNFLITDLANQRTILQMNAHV